MPYFKVLIQGKDISVLSEDGTACVRGFFATRLVKAHSVVEATSTAKAIILSEWALNEASNSQGIPSLAVESVDQTSFFRWLVFKNAGFTFYATSPTNEAV